MPFVPTPTEVALVNQIFLRGDTQKLNALHGDKAVGIFKAANLPEATLGDIWGIGDPENNGFLTRAGCARVVRLIGWAQHGEVNIGDHLLEIVGPPAVLEGYATPAAQSPPVPRLPAQIATIAPLPPLTPQDRQKFLGLFNGQGPVSGYLSGEKAKELFIRSKLPAERLISIWNLADRENRGSLDSTEFVIAMYLIQGSMGNPPLIPVLPPSLPPVLVDAAAGRQILPVTSMQTGSSLHSPTFPSATAVSPQYTGGGGTNSVLRPQLTSTISPQMTGRPVPAAPLSRIPPAIPARPSTMFVVPPAVPGQFPFPFAKPNTIVPWEIQAAEKATSDGFFKGLDQQGLGYVEGTAAVPFMLLSNLPDATLAKVWDLADVKNDGRLTEESFAVAMHLINQVLAAKPLPDTLPVSLVPPSLRSEFGMPPATQQVSETQRDLFDLFVDVPPTSAPVQPQLVQSHQIGPTPFQYQYIGATPSAPGPFTIPMPTPAPAPQEPVKDLLGDDDEVIERLTHEHSSIFIDIGNTQTQLTQTATGYENAKTEREKLEAEVAWKAATLSQLQMQLASAKAGYEAESKLLATLKERYNAQLAEIQTTRTELITAESDLSALKLEKTEVGGALLRDKEEVRELQRRHKEVVEEAEEVKKEVEKAKKVARLQKGLLAIAKKQLGSVESDKAAAEKELNQTRNEAETAERDLREAEAELARSPPPPPSLGASQVSAPVSDGMNTPSVRATSPVPSIRSTTSPLSAPTLALPFQDPSIISVASPASSKSNNPFERLAFSRSNSNSPFQAASPPPAQPATVPNPGTEDDDPFGFNASPSAATITPLKTVSPQNTGGMGAPTPGSDTTINANVNHGPQASFAESDAFFTPPSSTVTERMETQDSVVAAAVSQFPDLTESVVPAPPVTADPDPVDEPIDLNLPPLSEIKEADDSSDDNDEDEEHFKAARKAVKADVFPRPAIGPPAMAEPPQQSQPVNAGTAAFEDLFGVSPATSNAATTTGSDFSNISANPQQAPVAQNGSVFRADSFFDSMTSTAPPAPANGATSAASAFDDVMGTTANVQDQPNGAPFEVDKAFDFNSFGPSQAIHSPQDSTNGASAFPTTGPPTALSSNEPFGTSAAIMPDKGLPPNGVPFKFDKAFDEPFDFNSFTTPELSQAIHAPQVATNEASAFPMTTGPPTALSFDDAFGTSTLGIPDKGKQAQPLSFDDAFDVESVVPVSQPQLVAEPLAQQRPIPAPSLASTIQAPTPRQHQETSSVAPTSPTALSSQAPMSIRSASPSPTQQSTKERVQGAASPRPRSSEGSHLSISAKTSASQSEPPPTKHSRFSLFSRSKTKKEKHEKSQVVKGRVGKGRDVPPVPGMPARLVGDQGDAAAPDDLDAVKGLCAMGFSRHQAVEALEKHDYNFNAALNSLLGT